MNDERMARPVSGEIMSGAAPASSARPGGPSVSPLGGPFVDAEFESLPAAAQARPRAEPPQPAAAADAPARGMDILKEAPQPAGARRAGPAFWLFGIALAAGAFWVSGGHALVSRPEPAAAIPASAPADPREALRITGVASRIEKGGNGRSFVLVDGEVVNTGRDPAAVPPLDIRVTDGAGRSTLYVLNSGGRLLAPSRRFPFSSRLEAPVDGVGTVTVDFSTETN